MTCGSSNFTRVNGCKIRRAPYVLQTGVNHVHLFEIQVTCIYLVGNSSIFVPIIPATVFTAHNMSHAIDANFWILGDHRNVFAIPTAKTQTVGGMKAVIKENQKPSFDSIPSRVIKLWKVSIDC